MIPILLSTTSSALVESLVSNFAQTSIFVCLSSVFMMYLVETNHTRSLGLDSHVRQELGPKSRTPPTTERSRTDQHFSIAARVDANGEKQDARLGTLTLVPMACKCSILGHIASPDEQWRRSIVVVIRNDWRILDLHGPSIERGNIRPGATKQASSGTRQYAATTAQDI
jgi:hypothetical protein